MPELDVGDRAPDFELPIGPEETVSLSGMLQDHDYVALAFFPAAWSPACSDEVSVIQAVIDEIERLGAGVIGVSTDNFWSTRAWAEELGISFPLGSDFEPKGEVTKAYGVYHEAGVCKRAQFVIDSDMVVRFKHVSPMDKSPGVHLVLEALEELNADA
ncbi:MAG: redoxin domain-containing protein [Armatimonadota bacterium]|nr:redoxin domain-containing protein [Armatimonadota bacterium]